LSDATPTTPRPRRERRAHFPIANSYHASIPAEERYLPSRFLTEFQARVAAAIREKNGIRGVSCNPVSVEAEVLTSIALAANITTIKQGGRVRVVCAAPEEDRRRRPHGYSDVELSKATRMNYYRVLHARARLSKRGLIRSRQPHRWLEEKGRFEGLPNITELTPDLFAKVGIPWAEAEAEHERLEVERTLKAQLEGQQRAKDQMAARERRGNDYEGWQPAKATRKAAVVVFDQAVDAEGRRIPHTDEERRRHVEITFRLGQDPAWREKARELQRAEAIRRWREELDPPT
jgi:hypothetical protein